MKLFIILFLLYVSLQTSSLSPITRGSDKVGCEDAGTLIKDLEKLNLCPYKRYTAPNLFICYGYNLSFPRAKDEIEKVGGDWDKIISQQQCLLQSQCDSLFNATFRIASQLASYAFGNRVCPCEFALLVDAVYSLGPVISAISQLKVAVEYKEWAKVVQVLESLDWCPMNEERCTRDTRLILKGCKQ